MVLDKKAKKVIKYIVNHHSDDLGELIDVSSADVNMHYSELNAACEYLIKQGLLDSYYPTFDEDSPASVILTHEGLHYFEHKALKFRELWLKNAWIPIVVAFITTLLSNYILPKLWQILK